MARRYESDPMVGDLGECSVCGNVRTLTVKGVLRVHGDPKQRGMNCPGSGRAPEPEGGETP
jgi:hypothetical protein